MARQLTANVVVRHPESGVPRLLSSGSDLPDWADGLVGDHVLSGESFNSGGRSNGDPPPQQGSGSSKAAWSEYARANGVPVSSDMSRDDVIDACRRAGVRVD